MAKTIKATLRNRTGSGALNAMRREGYIPSVIYGVTENKNVKVHAKTITDYLHDQPSSQVLVNLEIEGGETHEVFIQDIQFDALTDSILHLDFLAVNDQTVLTAKLPVKLLGEPVGVKSGGQLEQLVYSIEVKSLPKDLPKTITAKVADLNVEDTLTIGDVEFPEGVTPVLDAKVLVALVAKTRAAQSASSDAAADDSAEEEAAGEQEEA